MRVALFGGTFDPPHLGHLHIARTAAERLHLDQVLLAPTGRQPLKSHHPAPFPDRIAMLQLLIAGHPHLTASALDAPHPDARPNYTADTLTRLRAELPPTTELFFLAGADSFLTLAHWHRAEALLSRTLLDGWILAGRRGFPFAALPEALPPGYTLGPPRHLYPHVLTHTLLAPHHQGAAPLHLLPDLDDPSTATAVREALAAGLPPPHLSPRISAYIREHRLYSTAGPVLR
jgi:nicotinate-nucleotide adenylyltransferase